MDFKDLLNKLDKLDQRQLLQESATNLVDQALSEDLQILKEAYVTLMERLHYKEIMATARILDDEERKQTLGAMAKKYGYPGLFDPVSGKWVDTEGQYAWFGSYKTEVERLEQHGLIPPAAKTSALLGMMGKDQGDARKNSMVVSDRDELVDQANALISKAKESYKDVSVDFAQTPTPVAKESADKFRSGLAQSLTESFGYSFKQLIEGITRDEHKKLKQIIDSVKDVQNDEDVTILMHTYGEYTKIREVLINRIRKIISQIQALKAQPLKESREMLREEIYFIGDDVTKDISVMALYYDANDNLVEYSVKQGLDDTSDLGRGIAHGLTFGFSDNIVAFTKSAYKGTPYADELHKEIVRSEEAKKRSPYLFGSAEIIGSIPYMVTGVPGLVAFGAGTAAKYLGKNPHDEKEMIQWAKDHPGGEDPKIKHPTGAIDPKKPVQNGGDGAPDKAAIMKIQQMLKAKGADLGTTGPNKDGIDGVVGKYTIAAAKKYGVQLPGNRTSPASSNVSTSVAPTDTATAQQLMQALGATTPQDAVAKLEAMVKAAGGTDEAKIAIIAKLAGLDASSAAPAKNPVATKESITYSSMSESERMAYLRAKLSQIEETQIDESEMILEWAWLERATVGALELALGKGPQVALATLERVVPNIMSSGIKIGDQVFTRVAGTTKFVNSSTHATVEAEQIVHLLANTAPVGELFQFSGKMYTKLGNGWAEVGAGGKAAKMAPGNISKTVEKEWAASKGKDPRAAFKPGEAPVKPGEAPVKPGEAPVKPGEAPTKPGSSSSSSSSASTSTAAAAEAETAAQGLVSKFPKWSRVTRKLKVYTGRGAQFLKNKKFWAVLAALAAWGYIWEPEGSDPYPDDPNHPPHNPNVVDPNVVPVKPEDDPNSPINIRRRQEQAFISALKELVKMLNEMFPDDEETRTVTAEAEAVMGGNSGSGQQPEPPKPAASSTSSSSVSPEVRAYRQADGSAQ